METEEKWLKKQLNWVDNEMKICFDKKTDNAMQSMVIYQVWRTQLNMRLKEII